MTSNPFPPRKTRRTPLRNPSANTMAMLPQWIQRTQTLVTLKEQALTSQKMWAHLRTTLPAELADAVRPGKWAEGVWHLTASSPAVAAKLKLYGPMLLRQLQQAQWPLQRIMVRVHEPRSLQTTNQTRADVVAPSQASASVRERLRLLRTRYAKNRED